MVTSEVLGESYWDRPLSESPWLCTGKNLTVSQKQSENRFIQGESHPTDRIWACYQKATFHRQKVKVR